MICNDLPLDHGYVKKLCFFFSAFLRHCTQDFWCHRISSWHCLSSISLAISTSSSSSLYVMPSFMIKDYICYIWSSRSFSAWKMFPKYVLILSFSFNLRFFGLCWNLYIHIPWVVFTSSHHCWMFHWRFGCLSQKKKKWKGFLWGEPVMSSHSWMGKWLDPLPIE